MPIYRVTGHRDRIAARLCDHLNSPPTLCSAPICENHARQIDPDWRLCLRLAAECFGAAARRADGRAAQLEGVQLIFG